jgi:hypothetical protein
MRRSTVNLLILAALCLLGWPVASAAESQRSQSRERKSGSAEFGRTRIVSEATQVWVVQLQSNELRSTVDAAKDEVWNKARNQVASLVRQYRPDLNWAPSLKFLKDKLRCGEPETKEEKIIEIDGERKYLYTAWLRLELTPAAREEMLRMVRLEEAWDRQWALAKGMIPILALLVVVALYLRLSEWLKVGSPRTS